jgi:hypothetical protein
VDRAAADTETADAAMADAVIVAGRIEIPSVVRAAAALPPQFRA